MSDEPDCKWCTAMGDPGILSCECMDHCQESEDGKHEIDPHSARCSLERWGGLDFDVECKYCRCQGSMIVESEDINW